jgi:glycosyltransferase involved in cell wall biosynthesis
MPEKKVLILGKLPPPYMGPAIATEIILKSSLKNYFELIHLDTRVNEDLTNIGKWSFKKFFASIGMYFKMAQLLGRHKPDLVLIPFSQDTMPFIKDSFFILLSKIYGRKVLLHLRGSNFLGWISKTSSLTKWYVKKVIRLSDGVIVLGKNLRYLFRDYLSEEKIFVVPNGADFRFPSRTGTSFRILYFANLLRAKGVEDLLKAIKILTEKGQTGFQADVVGSWRNSVFEKECKAIVSENHLPVIFHEPASGEKKMLFFSNADVFVFTPREPEGHPWVIVEAMAAGLPVISTDKGAIVESIKNGENGFIVPVSSPESIAARLAELMNDKDLRARMGNESRKLYADNFTEEKMVSNLRDVFQKVISD